MLIIKTIIISQLIFGNISCDSFQKKSQEFIFSEFGRQNKGHEIRFNANRIYLFDTNYYEGGVFSQDPYYLFEFNLTDSFCYVREKNAENKEWLLFYSEFRDFGRIKIAGVDYKTTWKDSTYLTGKRNQIIFLEPLNNIFISHVNEFIFNKEVGIIGVIVNGTLYIRMDIEDEFKLE